MCIRTPLYGCRTQIPVFSTTSTTKISGCSSGCTTKSTCCPASGCPVGNEFTKLYFVDSSAAMVPKLEKCSLTCFPQVTFLDVSSSFTTSLSQLAAASDSILNTCGEVSGFETSAIRADLSWNATTQTLTTEIFAVTQPIKEGRAILEFCDASGITTSVCKTISSIAVGSSFVDNSASTSAANVTKIKVILCVCTTIAVLHETISSLQGSVQTLQTQLLPEMSVRSQDTQVLYTNGTFVVLDFSNSLTDIGNISYSAGVFTIGTSGLYTISYQSSVNYATSVSSATSFFQLNSTVDTVRRYGQNTDLPSAAATALLAGTMSLNLQAGETIRFYLRAFGTGAANTPSAIGATSSNICSIVRVGND